jgi:beta-glucosidase
MMRAFGLLAAYALLCRALRDPERDLQLEPGAIRLPDDFLLGTATAAHQIEGHTSNDWTRFEPRVPPSGAACDHWNRVNEDIALMVELGANAYRFSIEWSRLEPTPGVWHEVSWQHYREELLELRRVGIVPMVTLLHFSLPAWLEGVTDPDFPQRFGRFATEAERRLGDLVELWCTMNEPNVQMLTGYVEGIWPPGHTDPARAGQALLGLVKAHARGYRALKERGAQVGPVVNLVVLEPASSWSLLDWAAARTAAQAYNWSFLDAIVTGRFRLQVPGWPTIDQRVEGLKGSADFLGLNYYTRYRIRFAPRLKGMLERVHGPGPRTDLDWEIYPDGLLRLLRQAWSRYRLPIYVTENGIADAAGDRREAYLESHLRATSQAIEEGIPVRGYFHWSLLDNYEWHEGYHPRFGLYRVDYATQQRSPAPGFELFQHYGRQIRGDS